MQYAYVKNEKVAAIKGLNGNCIACGARVTAKCGELKTHHWAHYSKRDCDPWWENETEWHRAWKELFPENYREIIKYDKENKEFHRADIHTPYGVTLEFQNSSLNINELRSREAFYKKLIWILNGQKLKGLQISYGIPNPNDPTLIGYEIFGDFSPSYSPTEQRFWPKRHKEIYNLKEPHSHHIKISNKYDAYKWKFRHKVWLYATSPVLIDLGGEFLYWLKRREQLTGAFHYLQKVNKKEFIDKYSF